MKKSVVIASDIVNSAELSKQTFSFFIEQSKKLTQYTAIAQTEIFRGDGLQTLLAKPAQAIQMAILQFCYFGTHQIQIRQAIGIGKIELLNQDLATSKGSAFELSGKGLDALKEQQLILSVHFEQDSKNEEWQIHSHVLSDIIENWSVQQMEAMLLHLNGNTQQQIAEQLNISQAAVHQRLKTAKLPLVQLFIQRFEKQYTK